jgi:hypothetical protein
MMSYRVLVGDDRLTQCKEFMKNEVYNLIIEVFPELMRQLSVFERVPDGPVAMRNIDFDSVSDLHCMWHSSQIPSPFRSTLLMI